MPSLLSCVIAVLVLFETSVKFAEGQWDPNNGIYSEPQWEKPRRKRTSGADEPWPPWLAPECPPDLQSYCMLPPYYPYDVVRREIPNIGIVLGRSMAYKLHRYINLFLGVPYAKPPVYERRFKPPEDPGPNWDMGIRDWDASYYRDACPQELFNYQHLYNTPRNHSEDCLHLNIFAPNLTDRPEFINRKYPVLVFIPGEDYKNGDSMLYPVHLLAHKEVLVVTANYRLGALGFLSTLDHNAPGNYGLMDIIHVLKFIQKNIREFGGNPDKVTLLGTGSGAAMVGLLLVSPKAYDDVTGKQLFHQAILMGGSDLCEWSIVDTIWNANAVTYARDLGRLVGCGFDYDQSNEYLVDCLLKKHYDEIVNATASIPKRYGSLSGPFAPVVDGFILPDTPVNLRNAKKHMKVKVLAGLTKDEGAYYAYNLTKNLVGVNMVKGLDPGTFRDLVVNMVQQRAAIQNVYEVVGAVEFEYTFWAKPDNESAVRQNLIDLWSDFVYGSCIDGFLKSQAGDCEPGDHDCPAVYMYLFTHRSEFEPLPFWMGVPHGRDVDYLIGYPFFNETLGNITGIVPEQTDWTYIDRNMSEFIQDTWMNFTKYGVPTPDWTRNISWFQFYKYNLSYLHIAEFGYMELNYRQNHFAFWRDYFPTVSARPPITTTPEPTPRPRIQYQIATWSLVGASVITLIVIVLLGITLYLRTRSL